jgi:hypothetical protein
MIQRTFPVIPVSQRPEALRRAVTLVYTRFIEFVGRLAAEAPVVDGYLASSVALTTGTNLVKHGLGRVPTGVVVQSKSGAADVYLAQRSTASSDKVADIRAATSVTATLWVF